MGMDREPTVYNSKECWIKTMKWCHQLKKLKLKGASVSGETLTQKKVNEDAIKVTDA